MTRPPPAPSTADPHENNVRLCRGCGYDVRSVSDGRCPECGRVLDAGGTVVVGDEAARVRGMLRWGMWSLILMWITLLGPFVGLSHLFRRKSLVADAQPVAMTTLVIAMLAFASIAVYALAEGGRRYRFICAHLAAFEAADLRGRLWTILGLMLGPTLVILAIRPLL